MKRLITNYAWNSATVNDTLLNIFACVLCLNIF
jgi:hypothetical protein